MKIFKERLYISKISLKEMSQNKLLRISKNVWSTTKGLTFPNYAVDLVGCSVAHPNIAPAFPKATVVFMRNCNRFFIKQYLRPESVMFPKVTHFYLMNSPCNYDVGQRFIKGPVRLYINADELFEQLRSDTDRDLVFVRSISRRQLLERVETAEKYMGINC